MAALAGAAGADGDARPFKRRKQSFLERRHVKAAAAAGLGPLDRREEELERLLLEKVLPECGIETAKSFLENKATYDGSPLLKLMQRMPKGAVLHTHGIASGDFRQLVGLLRTDGHFYVWDGDDSEDKGSVRSFATEEEARGTGWKPARDIAEEQLYGYITLAPRLPSVEVCWIEFGKIWMRVRLVACVAPFYYGRGRFFWTILQSFKDSNVMYVEIKEALFAPWTDYSGKAFSDDEAMKFFIDTVDEFRKENPGFLGARLVLTALKSQSEEDIRASYRRAVALKRKYPAYVAGFDLAGPEDTCRPIEDFVQVLEAERRGEHVATPGEEREAAILDQERAAAPDVDLPLLLHAGETNVPSATQIYDAVLLGCRRIGHGFALARHPDLLGEALASKVALECCPISNQVLGYCHDLANHPTLGLMRAGMLVTISPDDPGMWHYSDVSYDFAAVAKAWHLRLAELKALARNSITCSTLGAVEKEAALRRWEADWHAWVEAELQKSAAP